MIRVEYGPGSPLLEVSRLFEENRSGFFQMAKRGDGAPLAAGQVFFLVGFKGIAFLINRCGQIQESDHALSVWRDCWCVPVDAKITIYPEGALK